MIVFNDFFIDVTFHFIILMLFSSYFLGTKELIQQLIFAIVFAYIITYINHKYFKRYSVKALFNSPLFNSSFSILEVL
jgi:hypothetical protein